jgi:phage/plasmid-like protein (TIGR03299 family)
MAHEVETMLTVGEKPWHGLGVLFPEGTKLTPREAIVAAGLDWQVEARPTFSFQNNELVEVPAKTIVRTRDERIFGVVGEDYYPIQNATAFEALAPFIEAGEATIESAGSLRGGRRVWVLCKISRDPLDVVPGDPVERYMLAATGHDGTFCYRQGFTAVRVVCANTLRAAVDDDGSQLVRVLHTKGSEDTIKRVSEIMDAKQEAFLATVEQYRRLASRQIKDKDLEKYVRVVFAQKRRLVDLGKLGAEDKPRVLADVKSLFESSPTINRPGVRGTWWGGLNAVTEYLTHRRGNDPATRRDSVWFGDSAVLIGRATETAIKMAA